MELSQQVRNLLNKAREENAKIIATTDRKEQLSAERNLGKLCREIFRQLDVETLLNDLRSDKKPRKG